MIPLFKHLVMTVSSFLLFIQDKKTHKLTNFIKKVSFTYCSSIHPASKCDFEDGSCGWYELTLGDGFDWVRGTSAEVPPDYYGHPPPLDHSNNSTQGKILKKRTHTI